MCPYPQVPKIWKFIIKYNFPNDRWLQLSAHNIFFIFIFIFSAVPRFSVCVFFFYIINTTVTLLRRLNVSAAIRFYAFLVYHKIRLIQLWRDKIVIDTVRVYIMLCNYCHHLSTSSLNFFFDLIAAVQRQNRSFKRMNQVKCRIEQF